MANFEFKQSHRNPEDKNETLEFTGNIEAENAAAAKKILVDNLRKIEGVDRKSIKVEVKEVKE